MGTSTLSSAEHDPINMAFVKAVIILAILAVIAANPLCSNGDEKTKRDVEDLREFLANLPSKMENESKFPVIPGELSPLVPCQTQSRKKRHNGFLASWRRNKCPFGYYRLAFRCVKMT